MNHSEKPIRDHFDHCPACGQKSEIEAPSAAFDCHHCGLEIHFSPITSAAALIEDPSGNLLFIKRKKDPKKGKLGLPGGFLNPGETLEDALLREVKEEVGLDLESWNYLGGWPNNYSYRSVVYSVTDIYFAAKVSDFGSIQTCPNEVDGILIANPRYIDPGDLAFPSLRAAVKTYLKLRYNEQGSI